MKEKVIPSKKLYVASVFIFICGIVLFVILLITGLFSSIKGIDNQVVVPGTKIIELEDAGKYKIFLEYRSIVDNEVFEATNVSGLVCSLKDVVTGENIELRNSSIQSNYSIAGREGRSIFDFEISKPGKYEVSGWYETEKSDRVVLAIGKSFGGKLARTILLCIGVLFISMAISITLFAYTYVNRKKYSHLVAK